MTRLRKVALVAATVFLLGAAVATTFVPAYRSGEPCGTWVSPARPSEGPIVLLTELGAGKRQIQRDTQQVAEMAILEQRCDERLDSRRLLSLILGGLAIALPLGAFVLGARRRERW